MCLCERVCVCLLVYVYSSCHVRMCMCACDCAEMHAAAVLLHFYFQPLLLSFNHN